MVLRSLLVIGGLKSFGLSSARAEPCDPAPLRARLEREAARVSTWRWAWAAGFGVAALGQGIAAAVVDDHDQRETLITSASKAALGLGARLVVPLRIPPLPAAQPDACADLVALRAVVARAGAHERTTFWLNHLGGFAVNAGGAVWLTARTNGKLGLLSFALGFPVGLASTYTMPRWAWHAWRDHDAMVVAMPVDGGVITGLAGAW
ncbi:MAG: hypothetical protein NT062_07480 [Proteobacteria bacterium]|nr:hypothetical protein [Pseudomonadota bacterium]